MKKRDLLFTGILVTIAIYLIAGMLGGCNGSPGIGGVTISVKTARPSSTPRNTDTPTQTYTPSITPTATKVPDLEIFNDRLIDLSNTVGGVYFFSRMRNNTDTTMVLPSREYAFTFNFEDFEPFGDFVIWHDTFGPYGLKPGMLDHGLNSNCILYPHENGVIWFRLSLLDELPDYTSNREELPKYDGPLGITYTYSSTYTSNPDLPDKYHPRAENIQYVINDGNIYFEYDINVPAPKNMENERGMVMGFLIMYDSEENILNILYTDIYSYLPYRTGFDREVHMQGQSPLGDVPVRWSHFMKIDEEMLNKVDHVEMLFEVQYEGICFDKRHD